MFSEHRRRATALWCDHDLVNRRPVDVCGIQREGGKRKRLALRKDGNLAAAADFPLIDDNGAASRGAEPPNNQRDSRRSMHSLFLPMPQIPNKST